jgi:wyosine [tRNA(Phe)-imidazoG37] synthetase (radical SAM superfamily)
VEDQRLSAGALEVDDLAILQRPQALMRLSTFQTILEKIRPYAIEVILHNWGEPTLNPQILDIIRATRDAGIGLALPSVSAAVAFVRSVGVRYEPGD